MKLFILYQTDMWKSKISRAFFGIFDIRPKAMDCAKYNGLYCSNAKVVIEEVTLNIFDDLNLRFIFESNKVLPFSDKATQIKVDYDDFARPIYKMVGIPSGLPYHRLPATPSDADAPLQGLPTSPPSTHFIREKSPSETTTKPGADGEQFGKPKHRNI